MSLTVVGIGGSIRHDSQTERALRLVLGAAQDVGARTVALTGSQLVLPFYDPAVPERPEAARRLVEVLREADGVVLVSPGYHGTVSGLVKNALDYVEDLRTDERPYLDGRAVGCVAAAQGWQAAVTTLTALRQIVHALRGWPTPLGAAVNSRQVVFEPDGTAGDAAVTRTLRTDERPYLDGRAVGCVAAAQGWQAAVTTLTALRQIVHALRGWPTPLGAAVNSRQVVFEPDGTAGDAAVTRTLRTIGEQVVQFALDRHGTAAF